MHRGLFGYPPAEESEAGAGPRRRRGGDLPGRQDRHGEDQAGHMFSKPVSREVEAKDVKYAIERGLHRERRERLRPRLPGRPAGRPEGGGRLQGDPGHRDAGQEHDRLPPHQGHGRGARRRAVDADLGAGAEGVRAEVRREEPVDVRRGVRGLHRSVHGRVRCPGQGDRLRGRQDHQAGPQPRLRAGRRLPPGVPGRDRVPGRQRGHRRRVPPHPVGREPGRRRHRAALAAAQDAARRATSRTCPRCRAVACA